MAYVDLTSEFSYKFYITYQDMNQLAANDAYDHLAGGSVLSFYQSAAPVGWLKQIAINDSFVRIVDGAGGGSGGAAGLSSSFTGLAHTHNVDHNHTIANHTHVLDNTAAAAGHNAGTTPAIISANADNSAMLVASGSGTPTVRKHKNTTTSSGSGTLASTSGLLTDSALAAVTIKYIDVIVCTKGS